MEVRRNDERQRYELIDDGSVIGVADFHADGDTVVFPHTEIVPQLRGNGLGDTLVRGALDDVRQRDPDVKIVPACWFVADFLDNNPGYAGLRAT